MMSNPNKDESWDPPTRAAQLLMRVVPTLYRLFRTVLVDRFPHLSGLPQLRILLRLTTDPHLSLKDLAEREGVTAPTMSKSVDSLVEKGWVVRTTSSGDRRSIQIALTPKGAALANEVVDDLRTQFAIRLGSWDKRSLGVLIEAMTLLESSGILEPDSANGGKPV